MDVYNASSTVTSEALMCFAKAPQRVVFRAGERLYRFASLPSPTFDGNEVYSSPWWCPADTYRQITKTAHRTGQTTSAVGRSRLAIAEPWNPTMAWLTILELRRSVYGWVGPTRTQPLSGGQRAVMLLGNYDQAYVPGLAPPGAMASEAGLLVYYGSASG